MRVRITFLVATFFCVFLSAAPSSQAQELPAFTTSLNSTYRLSETAPPRVTHEVTVINETREAFIQEFSLRVNSQTITDAVASSALEPSIPVTVTKEREQTRLAVNFARPVLGVGKSSSFALSYTDSSLYSQTGLIKEVQIPPFEHGLPVTTHTVTVEVPPSFAVLSRSHPQPSQLSTLASATTYHFNFSGAGSSAIYLLFGQKQRYDLLLRYHLENPTITPVYTQIVLAPDTAYQRVFYSSIEPPPSAVTTDRDGNWIASFTLEPKSEHSVIAKGFVEVFDKPEPFVNTSAIDHRIYTQAQPYWETGELDKALLQLATPQAVYDYVVSALTYDYSRLTETIPARYGSQKTLDNPTQALCFEFTDVFVALARANGIPSRAVMGFAQTSNQSLRPLSANPEALHAWPEYYDTQTKQWRSVDPTWQKTTGGVDYFNHFDVNHVALAILGESSQSPLPAGYYKQEGVPTKDVFIQVARDTAFPHRSFVVKPEYPLASLVGLSNAITLRLIQTSGSALYSIPLSLAVTEGETSSVVVPFVLPFSAQEVTIPLVAHTWQPTLTTQVTYDTYTQTLKLNNPRPRQAAALILTATLGSSAAIYLTRRARRLLVQR